MNTWVEIKKSAIKNNLKQFRNIIGSEKKLMAIVKSNAYGHGMIGTAKIAVDSGVDWLGVINLKEALMLRKAKIKKPIFILSFWEKNNDVEKGIRENINFPVYTIAQAKFLSQKAIKIKKQAKIHIKLDTGANRIGIFPKDAKNFFQKLNKIPNIKINGIFTHFSSSESKNQAYTNKQINLFSKTLKELKKQKINIPLAHAGCSASTINNIKTHFDLVRVGIGLYGLWPSEETEQLAKENNLRVKLKPSLTWKTKIIQIKEIPKNSFIGYDCTFKTKKRIKLAVLPIGYWDGYNRQLSNPSPFKNKGGEVLIKGKRCSIVGRICMNLSMVDITELDNPKIGETVVLIGQQKNKEITVEEIAQKTKTINYEVVTRINPLIPRIYK